MEGARIQAHSRPSIKTLLPFLAQLASNWYELGAMLLEEKQEAHLSLIQDTYGVNKKKCCLAMLQYWMSTHSKATWYHLVTALRSPGVDLAAIASDIESKFTGTSQLYQQVTTLAIDQQQQPSMKSIADRSDDTEMKVNFSAYDDVSNAFDKLFTIFQKAIKVSSEEFRTIRNSCVARASEPLRGLIKRATDTHCLFEILADNNKYCNWMNVSFLKVIAIACGNENLQSLIKNYTDVIYSKPLREVWSCIPHYSVRDRYYSKLKATFGDRDPDNMTVEELMKSKPQLAKKIAMLIAVVEEGSLLVTWLIPTDELYQSYLSFLTIPQQSRMDELVQFGNWMVYLPKSVLLKYKEEISCGAVSIPTLLITYYHGLLLRDIDADQLTDKMCSTGLLTDHKQTVISSGCTVHHRNWLLLEYVRQLDLESLLKFCKLLQEEWPEIGTQLIMTLDSNRVSSSLSKSQWTTSVLSCCQCDRRSTTNTSIVLVLYFHLIDQLEELLKSYDYEMMMGQCRSLMASDHNDIKLFTVDQLKIFSQYNNAILLRTLCPFTWSNCSILRSLISYCSEAVQLLHRFECSLNPLQPISCYPIPCLSSDMIPSDTSTYTILAVRCDKELYKCTIQYVYDVQSVMIEKCDITQHCLQLLAVRSDPTILYWTIPKCVVDLINTNIPLHSEYLYSRGILEVLVYPDLLLTAGDDVCYGKLAFECVDIERDVLKQSSMEAFEELLDERNMLRSELTTEDSLIEEQRKEIEKKKPCAVDVHDTTDTTSSGTREVLSTGSAKPTNNTSATFSANQSSVFLGHDLPDDITDKDVLSFLREYVQVIVNVEIFYNRWYGNHAKIVFVTLSDAHAAIKQYNASYWEELDVCVTMKLWKGKKKDTTKYQKEGTSVKTHVVQDDGRKSITSSPPSSVDPVKPGKPVHDEGDVKVCKPKRQTKQSHYSSSQSLNSDYSEKQYAEVHTIKLSGLKFNIAERTLEELAKPFGHLANRVKIVHYPGICYAYVDYCHKSSAEEAVLQLDKSELSGTKIHVCHKSADHNCGRELKVLNNPNKLTLDVKLLSATPESGTLTSDTKATEQHEMELDKTEHQAHEVINLSPDASACTVDVVKANYVTKSPVSDLTVIRTGKEVATKSIQDAHTLVMKDTKKQSGVSSKKKTASLKQYQMLVLMVCMSNLVKNIKTSWNVTVTGFHEGSTCLNFKGDNFQMAYQYVMKHAGLCKSKELHCNMDTPLLAIAIKSIKKLRISVVICNTDGECLLPVLESVKGVYNDVVAIHSLYVKEIDRAIGILECSPHSRQIAIPSKDIKHQLKVRINEFQIKYMVSLVLKEGIIIQGYLEDDVIAAYEELKELIDDLSQVTIEYSNSREEIQFLRYVMFYKQTGQAKMLLAHLSESLSLKIQKSKTSLTLTGNPVATTEGIKIIDEQLLGNFQVETFGYRCHPDFVQLIKESVKEPVEKDLDVVIYYFSVNGSEQLEPVKSVKIYVKVYSTDSTDFKRACNIIRKLKPQSHLFPLAEDEFEYIANTAEDTVDLTSVGEPFRVMIVVQHEKLGVTLHAFTAKEAKDCFHVLMQNISAALNLVSYVELTTLQMKYLCSSKSDLVKSLNIQFETSTNLPPKLKLEGKRSQVEKSTLKIQDLLNGIVTKSCKQIHDTYITMWKKCWHEIKDSISQDKELYVELATSASEDSITCELLVVGENIHKVESAISCATKVDGKVRECNIFGDAESIEILSAALAGNKLNIEKEIVYHIEIVQTNIIITTPYHLPVEQVKRTVETYILSEKEKLKIVRKLFEIHYSFLIVKLKSEWSTIQSFAKDCKVNLVTGSHCAIKVEGKKVAVEKAEPQILEYILSLESDVNPSVLPVDYYSRSVLQSSELLHLCKELESKSCISLRIQVYPEVLSSAIVRQFNPSVTVQICEGSISLDTSDVFINFTDANLTISEELRTLVGEEIHTAELNRVCSVKCYASQYNIKAVWSKFRNGDQTVIHAVIPNWVDGRSGEIDHITSAVIECLDIAVRENATSVSLPFLSSIDKNLPVKILAEGCLLAVHSFCKRYNFIHRIRLVLPSEMVKIFVDEFTTGIFQHLLVANNDKACSVQGDSIWLWKDHLDKYQCYESGEIKILNRESKTNPTCHLSIGRFTYKIDFSAMIQTNTSTQTVRSIKHVMGDCKWMVKSTSHNWEYFSLQDSMKIETNYVNNRTDFSMVIAGEWYTFHFSTMLQVNIQTGFYRCIKRLSTNESIPLSDKADSKIAILGLNADVEDAEVQLKSCINSLCLIKSVNIPASIVCTDLKKIERNHRVKICATATPMRYNVKGFKDNVQEAVTAIYQTIAQNSASISQPYYSRPTEWEPQSDAIELMNVSKGSSEWNKILNRMQETLPTVKLSSIHRIQNEHLWEKYCQHKERMGRKGLERVNEKELFHGTSNTPPEDIYKSEEGFDMRFSRPGMWGQGNYFAESARYSASGYSYQKETTHTLFYVFSRTVREKQIFLARVLTGDSYRSRPDQTLRIPPLKTTSSSEGIRYDTVNGISHGGELIYIAYSNDKAYPMYLITFTD